MRQGMKHPRGRAAAWAVRLSISPKTYGAEVLGSPRRLGGDAWQLEQRAQGGKSAWSNVSFRLQGDIQTSDARNGCSACWPEVMA